MPGHSGPQSVIRHGLKGGIVEIGGHFKANFHVELLFPGEAELRPKEYRGYSRVFGGFTAEGIQALVLPGNDELHPGGEVVIARQVIAGPARPRQVIGKTVIDIARGPHIVVYRGAGKKFLPAAINLERYPPYPKSKYASILFINFIKNIKLTLNFPYRERGR